MPAYVLAALVPVGWVAVDLLFITKRFNFITTFLGLNAILRGVLAFWFVAGPLGRPLVMMSLKSPEVPDSRSHPKG